jgi:branched-chain amino acid transport system ATP-binding protein
MSAPPARHRAMQALSIIRDEHRSLAAVLHGMMYLVREIRLADTAPDFDVLEAMVGYVESFVERCHHPKEDRYLFRLLRRCRPEAIPLIERLEEEHRSGDARIRALRAALADYRARGAEAFPAFAAAAAGYSAFNYAHMRAEETEILPMAEAAFGPADRDEIDAAFLGNDDPLVGARAGQDYAKLFRRIVEIAPPPLGAGHAARAAP